MNRGSIGLSFCAFVILTAILGCQDKRHDSVADVESVRDCGSQGKGHAWVGTALTNSVNILVAIIDLRCEQYVLMKEIDVFNGMGPGHLHDFGLGETACRSVVGDLLECSRDAEALRDWTIAKKEELAAVESLVEKLNQTPYIERLPLVQTSSGNLANVDPAQEACQQGDSNSVQGAVPKRTMEIIQLQLAQRKLLYDVLLTALVEDGP